MKQSKNPLLQIQIKLRKPNLVLTLLVAMFFLFIGDQNTFAQSRIESVSPHPSDSHNTSPPVQNRSLACTTYSSSNVPIGLPNGTSSASSTLSIPASETISDVNVTIDMPHEWVGDLTFTLSHNSTSVVIIDRPGVPSSSWGCSRDNISATLDDEASANIEAQCASSTPTINGTFTPNNALSAFDGLNSAGTWTLSMTDAYTSADAGTLNNWSLEICSDAPVPTATPITQPTATSTPLPTATNTPVSTATPLPTATNTPLPTTPPTSVPTATPITPSCSTFSSGDTPKSLPNGTSSISSSLNVSGVSTITDVNLNVDMPHEWVGDLTFTLAHNGTNVVVIDRPGVPASTWGCANNNILATLDDEASQSVETECSGSAPTVNGTFQPNNLLSAYDGMDANGTWTLTVADAYTGADTGTLNGWSLEICGGSPPPTAVPTNTPLPTNTPTPGPTPPPTATPSPIGGTAPDPTGFGSFSVTSSEYRLGPSVDSTILSDRQTEIWARMYRPTDMSQGPYPLVVILHGNHSTCGTGSNPRVDNRADYTNSGSCPGGYVVVPNHAGYGYLAEPLASNGYIVVSINANRGITAGAGISGDSGLNLARGRLILKHLQLLSQWNSSGGAPSSLGLGSNGLVGRLDFSEVGLIGHSRGGEGVRAAYEQYRDVGSPWPNRIGSLNVRGIFEIGPVDGQTSRVLNAEDTNWAVLLPMCDGDVWEYMGWDVFGRAMLDSDESLTNMKAFYNVWGTNHNYYNTEWQQDDGGGSASASCTGSNHPELFGSVGPDNEVMQTGKYGILPFIRGSVGVQRDETLLQNLDPLYDLPSGISGLTQIDRAFADSTNSSIVAVVDNFNNSTGTSSTGVSNNSSSVSVSHQFVQADSSASSSSSNWKQQRAARIRWTSTGSNRYFQSNWRNLGQGVDVNAYRTLDLRVGREYSRSENLNAPTNFSVHLVMANGSLSNGVQLNQYVYVRDGGGYNTYVGNTWHTVMAMARIPLSDFGADLSNVRGVRLVFDDGSTSGSGAIYVGNIRFVKEVSSYRMPREMAMTSTGIAYTDHRAQVEETARLTQLTLNGATHFEIINGLYELRIGRDSFTLSGYKDPADLQSLVFMVDPAVLADIRSGTPMTIHSGENSRSFGVYEQGVTEYDEMVSDPTSAELSSTQTTTSSLPLQIILLFTIAGLTTLILARFIRKIDA